jgi:N,N'-diacetyllegionaminate synthase
MTFKIIKKTYIIAEAGVNHNGDYKLAKKLISKAAQCKADAVKFQIFKANDICLKNTKMAEYQKKNIKKKMSQYEMLQSFEFLNDEYLKLKNYAKKKNIDFLVSVFDDSSLKYFNKSIKGHLLKIPSGEITNYFLLKSLDLKKYKIILSTGMSNIREIKEAVNLISRCNVYELRNNRIVIKNKKKYSYIRNKIFLLHCVSDYPAEEKFLNLECIKTLKEYFGLNVGFSDHTKGNFASTLAVAVGANIIEKHFTLSKIMKGPDHSSSLNPEELKKFVNRIRRAEIILGSKIKKAQPCELSNIKSIRKSLVARKDIKKNEIIMEDNLTAKRPGTGVSPMQIHKLTNKFSKKNLKKDEMLK